MGTTEGIDVKYNAAIEHFGAVDILINNAGVFIESSFLTTNEEGFDRTMDVIIKGTYFLLKK